MNDRIAGRLRLSLAAASMILLPCLGLQGALAGAEQVHDLAQTVDICKVPDPGSPSSGVRHREIEAGRPWRLLGRVPLQGDMRRLDGLHGAVPHGAGGNPLMEGERQKQGLAFVVDKMGGHLSFTTGQAGDKTVLLHEGSGGTRFAQGLASQIERASDARVVMVRWDAGYTDIVSGPGFPVAWGWFTPELGKARPPSPD